MRTILKTWDLVFAYLNCLSCFRFFIVYLKSDKVSILFFISQVREFQMMGVKYLAECFSKKTQKSALGRNYYQILMHKNQTLCSIVWNYVHKSMLSSTADTARPYSTIFNETIIFLSLIVACYFNVLYKICLVPNISQKSCCNHHILLTFFRLTGSNWAEIWKMS